MTPSRSPDQAGLGSALVSWFLALPRRVQMAAFAAVLYALASLTGVDSAVMNTVLESLGVETTPATAPVDLPAEIEDARALEGLAR